MKNSSRRAKAPMSADAYAGFLKLFLTPSSKAPELSRDVQSYLRHVSEREPLSAATRKLIGQQTERAA